jgi:hypothetical protein
MAKIYFVRHQAHGIVHEYPFASHPTADQVEAVRKFCFNVHGFGHPKTPKEPYWTRVVERDVLGDEVPAVPERKLGVAGKSGVAEADAPEFAVSGTGVVG